MRAPPTVAMFCGNIFVRGAALEAGLAQTMREIIVREAVRVGYGALAAGSDILIAELLLAHGAELHVVLPFAESDFLAQSVAPAGAAWVDRYHAITRRASSIKVLSAGGYGGGASQFAHGSNVSMGMARLRARQLQYEAIQLAIVDPHSVGSLSGSDIHAWRATGGRAEVVTAQPLVRPVMPPPPTSNVAPGVHSLLFVQDAAASAQDWPRLSQVWEAVTARGPKPPDASAAGDGMVAKFDDAATAAAAALDLSAALAARGEATLGISLHAGCLHPHEGPVPRSRTPSGGVHVTEPFAAVLEMTPDNPFSCTPAGKIALPGDYGVFPAYRLDRRAPGA